MVVSTHLDDAVLSCYHALGPETAVVTVLAGAPRAGVLGSWDRDGGATDSVARVAERRAEDERALMQSGSRYVHLDFLDAQYGNQRDAAEIRTTLAPILESATHVLAPAGIGNLDHRLVRDAVLAVRNDAVLYADLPYALHADYGGFALPEEIADRDAERVELQLADAELAQKLAAVRCYRTQLDQLVAPFGDFLDAAGLGREVLWNP